MLRGGGGRGQSLGAQTGASCKQCTEITGTPLEALTDIATVGAHKHLLAMNIVAARVHGKAATGQPMGCCRQVNALENGVVAEGGGDEASLVQESEGEGVQMAH